MSGRSEDGPSLIEEDEQRQQQLRREHLRRQRKARRLALDEDEEQLETLERRETSPTDEPALIVDNVSVVFTVYGERSIGKFRRPVRNVQALDSVSFTVRRGEALGLIGPNGSGKTTLIRVMAGTLPPDSGSVETFDLNAEMLGLGAGFNNSLTGRRNIYLGCMASGMRKKEVDQVVDEIIEFTELGEAIDRPMETYSSGMKSRLAFAVAIQNEPDILLVDEALSVGDASFKEKSKVRMQQMLENTGTIVLVSHGVQRLRSFCDRIVWLDKGRVMMIDEPNEVIVGYRKFLGLPVDDDDDDD